MVVQHITLNYFTLYDFIFHFLWPCLFHHGVFSLAHLAFILFLGKQTGQPLRENLGRDGVFLRGCFAALHHDGEEKNEREIVHALTFNCTQHPLLELMSPRSILCLQYSYPRNSARFLPAHCLKLLPLCRSAYCPRKGAPLSPKAALSAHMAGYYFFFLSCISQKAIYPMRTTVVG